MLFTSQVIAAASGSAGGLTASRNRYGMYFRARSVPVNPNTTFQQDVRANLSAVVGMWAELTDIQRSAWETYGANVSVLNKLGQSVNLTGFAHYVRSNTARMQAGLPVVDDGPAVFSLPSFTPVTVSGVVGAGSMVGSIAFDDTQDWVDEDDAGMIYAVSRPVSPTINFFKGPFRYVDTILGDSGTPETSPEAFVSPFASAPGQRFYMQIRLSLADGRLSAVQIPSAIST